MLDTKLVAAALDATLGTLPRPVSSPTTSRDMRRVVANVRDYRADAWMSKVIR
jgi:hypothetical protein